jgi:hypothetical protein
MPRIRLIMLAALAVFAFSAVASSSASAKGWWVENNARTGSEALPLGVKAELSEGVVVKEAKIKLSGAIVKCNEITLLNKAKEEIEEPNHKPSESFIEGTNGGSIAGLQYSGCVVENPAGCELANAAGEPEDDITVGEITLKMSATEPKLEFKPKGELFAEIKFRNIAACGLLKGKTVKIKGFTKATMETPATCAFGQTSEQQYHKFVINEAPSTLEGVGATVEEFKQEFEIEGLETNGKGLVSDVCYDYQ